MSASETPVWWNPLQPLGAAIRYVGTLSPRVDWVGAYLLKADTLYLGPFVGEPTEHTQIPVGRGVCGTAVAENADQIVEDVGQRENYLACSLETRAEIVVLIRDPEGNTVGQIDIDSHKSGSFDSDFLDAVRKVAAELGERWNKIDVEPWLQA
jgi:L-methionine (R)-S-oxide reductase